MRFFVAVLCATLALTSAASAEKHVTVANPTLSPFLGNPYQHVSAPQVVPYWAVFDTLTRITGDGEVSPRLAVSWEFKDELTWHFTLRENVAFSNGEPVNAAAAAAAVRFVIEDDQALRMTIRNDFKPIKSARAIDNVTLEVTTHAPEAMLPRLLTALMIPAPEHFKAVGGLEGFVQDPVGSGPFKVEEWSRSRMDLVANPTSWTPPKLDRLTFLSLSDPSARVQGLLANAIDVALQVGPSDIPIIESVGGEVIIRTNGRTRVFSFDTISEDSPYRDPRVREAMNMAVNRQVIIDVLFAGATTPSTQGASPVAFGYNPELEAYPYDPERARALLAEAGYPDGFKDIAIAAGSGTADSAILQQIAFDLAQVGVDVELRSFPVPQFIRFIQEGGWPGDILNMDYTSWPYYDGLRPLRIHSCTWIAPWHCDEAQSAMIAETYATFDLTERKAKTQELQRIYREEPVSLFLWPIPTFDAFAERLTNVRTETGYYYYDEWDVTD